MEAAPLTDTADLIVDLTETGTTLRENRLKLLDDGIVLRSQACLVANARQLIQNPRALKVAETVLELMEARSQARNRSLLTAQVQADSRATVERIADELRQRLQMQMGQAELSISTSEITTSTDSSWYTLSGIINVGGLASELLETVAILRSFGATNMNITPLTYRFAETSTSISTLHQRLKRVAR